MRHTHEDNCDQLQEMRSDLNQLMDAQKLLIRHVGKGGPEEARVKAQEQQQFSDVSLVSDSDKDTGLGVSDSASMGEDDGAGVYRFKKTHHHHARKHVRDFMPNILLILPGVIDRNVSYAQLAIPFSQVLVQTCFIKTKNYFNSVAESTCIVT